MATSKLGLYLVQTGTKPSVTYLVISESASAAQSNAFDYSGYTREVSEAVRLGDYDPSMEGHRVVMQLTARSGDGAILMVMERNDAND